jgi:hypothetical protein
VPVRWLRPWLSRLICRRPPDTPGRRHGRLTSAHPEPLAHRDLCLHNTSIRQQIFKEPLVAVHGVFVRGTLGG